MKRVLALCLVFVLVFFVSCSGKPHNISSLVGDSSSSGEAEQSSAESTIEDSSNIKQSSSSTQNPSQSSSAEQNSSSNTSSDTKPQTPVVFEPVKSEDYYCYGKLTEVQKKAYTKILDAVVEMPERYIDIEEADKITERDIYVATIALKNDHPELFWLPYAWYIGKTHTEHMAILFVNNSPENVNQSIESFTATYTVERSKKDGMLTALKNEVEKIKSKVTARDPYGIELQLHDILCQRVTYNNAPTSLSYTAYGALVEGQAVCEGYTRAMQMMLYEFGILSTTVSGVAEGPHMWNLVQINGKWYHLDVTWDDQQSGIRHNYFNLTDTNIKKDHSINTTEGSLSDKDIVEDGKPYNPQLPTCNSTDDWYYQKTGFVYKNNADQLASYMLDNNIKKLEIIGWNNAAATALTNALKAKGHNLGFSYSYDSENSWAMLELK